MFNGDILGTTIINLINQKLNRYLSNCMLTSNQCSMILQYSKDQIGNLVSYIKQNHNYGGKIHSSKLEEIVESFIKNDAIPKLQQMQSSSMGGMNMNNGFMGQNNNNSVVSFQNQTPVSQGNFLDSFNAAGQPASVAVPMKPKSQPQKEFSVLKETQYVENVIDNNPLNKTNDVEGKLLAKHGMPGVIDIQSIREYRNKVNNSKYRFISAVYNIPEEKDGDVVKNFVTSLPDLTNHNKYMAFIRYPRFTILKNVEYDSILADYESVKKVAQGKSFFEAIKVLNNKAFNFSNELKKMLVRDINDMLERYVRTNTDIDTIIKIDEVEEIQELMSCNRSLGIDAFMMDDFDGFILSIVSEVFNRYFGKESVMYRIDKNINHILSHSEVIIRTPEFTDRDYYSLDGDKKTAFEEELKQYAVFGFMSNCILTNVFPDSIKESLSMYEAYMTNSPSNSFESMIFDNLHKQIKNYSVRAFSSNEQLALKIGKTIEGDLLLTKL